MADGRLDGDRQDLSDSLTSKKEVICPLCLLSRSEAWLFPGYSDRTSCYIKKMKIPLLKDIITVEISCLTHPYRLEWRTGPYRKWTGLISPSQEKYKHSSVQASSPSRSICSWCSIRLGTQQVHCVIDRVPLDRERNEQWFVIHHKVLLFHLLPFPGMQLWLFALCINL